MDHQQFYRTIMEQIQSYLEGHISKEDYCEIAESFYSKYAKHCINSLFCKYFLDTVADACLIYIEEPGLSPKEREERFYDVMSKAYQELRKPEYQ